MIRAMSNIVRTVTVDTQRQCESVAGVTRRCGKGDLPDRVAVLGHGVGLEVVGAADDQVDAVGVAAVGADDGH